jgi:predicted NAD/FAD-dependent oxidoreductase
VLVLGAGVSGLVAARELAGRGLDVTVVDKARGVGGRLATRRLAGGASFDHGAALFEPVSLRFLRLLDQWREDGLFERIEGGTGTGSVVPTYRLLGPATSLAKHLSRGLDLRLGVKGVALAREGSGFVLSMEDGEILRGSAAIVTAPVPQSLDLVVGGGSPDLLPPSLRLALEAVRYRPAFVLLLRLARRAPALGSSGVLVLRDGGPISRVIENARDGGPSNVSVYARADWAESRFDVAADEVSSTLQEAALKACGLDPAAVLERDLKRWRYARAAVVVPDEAPLVEVDGARLVFAGDAFGEPGQPGVPGAPGVPDGARPPLAGNTGLERALLSGLAAAGRI